MNEPNSVVGAVTIFYTSPNVLQIAHRQTGWRAYSLLSVALLVVVAITNSAFHESNSKTGFCEAEPT